MRYALIRSMDVSNGDKGLMCSIFFQGCNFRCKGCWNSCTWDFNGGKEFTKEVENKVIELVNNEHIVGLSILGGEPFHQPPKEILSFIKNVKLQTNKCIYLWTGYDFEEIPNEYKECLNYIDTIICGRFVEKLKDYTLKLRGSSNQEIYIKENDKWKKKS